MRTDSAAWTQERDAPPIHPWADYHTALIQVGVS